MKKIVILAVLGIAPVLSACGTSSSGEAARVVQGKVTDYSGSAGMLEAKDERNRVRVGTGTIDADGRFRLELEDLSERSGALIAPQDCPNVRVSDAAARGFSVTSVKVIADGDSLGSLDQSSESGDAESSTLTYVARMYVDRDVTVEGSCAPLSTDGEVVTTYDLDYKQGWNTALVEINSSSESSAFFVDEKTVSASEIEAVGWSYLPVEINDDPTELPATPDEISGQVRDYGGPEGYLEAATNSSFILAGYGFIDPDGSFSFQLNPKVLDAALEPITNLADCEGVSISDRDAKITRFGQISVFSQADDEVAGAIVRTDAPPTGENEASYTVVGRYYADRDVTAQGRCDSGNRIDLDLRRGWNVVTLKVEESANPLGIYTYTSGEPSDAAWYYVPNN